MFIVFSFATLNPIPIQAQQRFTFQQKKEMLHGPIDNYVMVVAHRGDWRNAPENSLPAIQYCIEMGVDMVEIDVQLTKDSIPILMHDKTLDRTTTGKGKVNHYTIEQIKTMKLRDGLGRPTTYHIPTLEEALLLCKGKILINLDKVENIIPIIYPVLRKTGTLTQIAIGSYKPLSEMRELAGTYLDSLCFMPKVKDNSINITEFLHEYESTLDFSILQLRFETEQASTIGLLDDGEVYDSWIWVNTITANRSAGHDDDSATHDPESAFGWLIAKGVNIIQTDRPQLLLDYLRGKGLHD